MNSLEYEVAVKKLQQSTQAKEFLPFYRNVLKPILEHSIISTLSGDKGLDTEDLVRVQAYSKIVKDMEIIMTRIIIQGETANKVVNKVIVGGNNESNS